MKHCRYYFPLLLHICASQAFQSLLLLSVGLQVANAPDVLQPCGLYYYPWCSNSHHQSSSKRSWQSEVELNLIIFRRSNFHFPSSQRWNYVCEKWPMNFAWNARLPRSIQESFTCCKSTTLDRRLYFPSEGRRAEDFFALKNPTASAGFEPANLGTKGQHATSRPPKPLVWVLLCTKAQKNDTKTKRQVVNYIRWGQFKRRNNITKVIEVLEIPNLSWRWQTRYLSINTFK